MVKQMILQRRPVDTGEEIVAALLQMLHHLRVDLWLTCPAPPGAFSSPFF
jgi:hypothetical protein